MNTLFESIISLPHYAIETSTLLEAYELVYGLMEAVDYEVMDTMGMKILAFETSKGTKVDIALDELPNDTIDASFSTDGTYGDTGSGDLEVVTMALAAMLDYFQTHRMPKHIVFSPFKGDGDVLRQRKMEYSKIGDYSMALDNLIAYADSKQIKIPGAKSLQQILTDFNEYNRYGSSILKRTLRQAEDELENFGPDTKMYTDALRLGLEEVLSVEDVNRRRNIYNRYVRRVCPKCTIDVKQEPSGEKVLITTPDE